MNIGVRLDLHRRGGYLVRALAAAFAACARRRLGEQRLDGALGAFVGAVRPAYLFAVQRSLAAAHANHTAARRIGRLRFTSFYKLAGLLSLNLAELRLLIFIHVAGAAAAGGAEFVVLGTFCVARASLVAAHGAPRGAH